MPGDRIATPTIPASTGAGPTSSTAVDLGTNLDHLRGWNVGVGAPGTLDGTVTLQLDRTSTGDWVDAKQDGSTASVTVPAGGARIVRNVPFPRLRLQSSTGEASSRDFEVWVQ